MKERKKIQRTGKAEKKARNVVVGRAKCEDDEILIDRKNWKKGEEKLGSRGREGENNCSQRNC